LDILLFVTSILILWIAVSFLSNHIFRKGIRFSVSVIVVFFDVILAIAFAYLAAVGESWLTWFSNFQLIALYLVFSAYAIANFICLFVCKTKSNLQGSKFIKYKTFLSLFFVLIISTYGIVNMQTIVPNEHTYYSDKIVRDHTFVVIADLHAGSSQSTKTINNALEDIKELQPDFLVLAGDITDEYTTKSEMLNIYQSIGSLNIPTYYVYGNHDRQGSTDLINDTEYSEVELDEALKENNIVILKDELANIGTDISLLGREDSSFEDRCAVDKLPKRDKSRYQITIDHKPYSYSDIYETKADLQVSGHTHAGQYFPLEQIELLAGYESYGEFVFGKTTLLVSSGAGGWHTPCRTSRHCNYEIIHLKNKSA